MLAIATNLGGLVRGCIDAGVCKQIFILQILFSRSTRYTYVCSAPTNWTCSQYVDNIVESDLFTNIYQLWWYLTQCCSTCWQSSKWLTTLSDLTVNVGKFGRKLAKCLPIVGLARWNYNVWIRHLQPSDLFIRSSGNTVETDIVSLSNLVSKYI